MQKGRSVIPTLLNLPLLSSPKEETFAVTETIDTWSTGGDWGTAAITDSRFIQLGPEDRRGNRGSPWHGPHCKSKSTNLRAFFRFLPFCSHTRQETATDWVHYLCCQCAFVKCGFRIHWRNMSAKLAVYFEPESYPLLASDWVIRLRWVNQTSLESDNLYCEKLFLKTALVVQQIATCWCRSLSDHQVVVQNRRFVSLGFMVCALIYL